jgi:hypothetical protein
MICSKTFGHRVEMGAVIADVVNAVQQIATKYGTRERRLETPKLCTMPAMPVMPAVFSERANAN